MGRALARRVTPLSPATPGAKLAILLVPLLLTAPFTGCIGDDASNDQARFRVFLSAVGSPSPATARLADVGVTLEASNTTRFLDLTKQTVDLASLADSGKAVLVAEGRELNGTATRTLVRFDSLVLGERNLTQPRLELPVTHPVGPQVEVTITLDLNASAAAEAPRVASVVVERAGTELKAVAGSQIHEPEREPVPELPSPTIVATSGSNATAPSFQINTDINFTYELPPTNATVRNTFWAFGDDRTATGRNVTHAYRDPGFYLVRAILEGARGQQAMANTTIDAYLRIEGQGNVGVGTAGTGAIEGRDVKNHTFDVPGNFTSITVRLEQSSSGGVDGTPSNVHVELYNADDELLARNTSDSRVKWLNVSGLMKGGEWELRVKGDQGAAVGYSYAIEAHYLGLCAKAGGVHGFACDPAPEPVG